MICDYTLLFKLASISPYLQIYWKLMMLLLSTPQASDVLFERYLDNLLKAKYLFRTTCRVKYLHFSLRNYKHKSSILPKEKDVLLFGRKILPYSLKMTVPEHNPSSILISWRVILGPISWSFTALLVEALLTLPRSDAKLTVAASSSPSLSDP